jgi:hypothetical protein
MDMINTHVAHIRQMKKQQQEQAKFMQMFNPNDPRYLRAKLGGGGGLTHGGGLTKGGGLMYKNAGNGVRDFGEGYHPELRKIMKADDHAKETEEAIAGYDLFSPEEQDIPVNEEDNFVAEAEAPEKVPEVVKKKKVDKSFVVVQGEVRQVRTNEKAVLDPVPKAGIDYIPHTMNAVQQEVLRKALEKAGDLTPFKARGNKQVVVVNDKGEVTKYTSLIKAHKSLGLTKHQLTGGKTPKKELDFHYNDTLKSLMLFMSKNNVKHFD